MKNSMVNEKSFALHSEKGHWKEILSWPRSMWIQCIATCPYEC
jgi:hypothetical protein